MMHAGAVAGAAAGEEEGQAQEEQAGADVAEKRMAREREAWAVAGSKASRHQIALVMQHQEYARRVLHASNAVFRGVRRQQEQEQQQLAQQQAPLQLHQKMPVGELPATRVRTIVRQEPALAGGRLKVRNEYVALMAKAAEMFIMELSGIGFACTEMGKRCTLRKDDVSYAVEHDEQFDFLIDTVPRLEGEARERSGHPPPPPTPQDQQLVEAARQEQIARMRQDPSIMAIYEHQMAAIYGSADSAGFQQQQQQQPQPQPQQTTNRAAASAFPVVHS